MRRLAALVLLVLACGVAVLAARLKQTADRLRGTPGPQAHDAITWAVIRAHEADLRAGRARWQ